MTLLFCDLETFSDVPITHGTHRYAERAEVMLWTYAFDDGPIQCWDVTQQAHTPTDLLVALNSPDVLTVWHNSCFDRTVIAHWQPGLCPPVERTHDTMAQALAHGLPGALGTLGDTLGVKEDEKKHKRGRELISLLCKPRPQTAKIRRATRETHPAEWAEFIEYAKADVASMRAVYHKLPTWNYKGAELALWQLDQRINNRGVAVDLELAHAALRATERAQATLAEQAHDLTNGDVHAATQRDKMLAHVLAEYSIDLPDMTASTVERRMDDPDLPPALRELLGVRLQASKTSASKYKRVIEATSSDGRLRGLLQFCGASRTGRWAGRLFQPQNLPRPTHPQGDIDQGIEAMKADVEDLVFDDVMALARSAIRGVIVAPEGGKLVVADLANIEGRAIAWLAGESWKLQAFREYDADIGPDLYKLAYARAFAIRHEDVAKPQRQIGKVMELMLGYEGGVGAFITGAASYNIDLDAMAEAAMPSVPGNVAHEARDFLDWRQVEEMGQFDLADETFIACDSLKRLWRAAHPKVASWWKELEEAARRAILSPGVTTSARSIKMRRDGAWLTRSSSCPPAAPCVTRARQLMSREK